MKICAYILSQHLKTRRDPSCWLLLENHRIWPFWTHIPLTLAWSPVAASCWDWWGSAVHPRLPMHLQFRCGPGLHWHPFPLALFSPHSSWVLSAPYTFLPLSSDFMGWMKTRSDERVSWTDLTSCFQAPCGWQTAFPNCNKISMWALHPKYRLVRPYKLNPSGLGEKEPLRASG